MLTWLRPGCLPAERVSLITPADVPAHVVAEVAASGCLLGSSSARQ